MSKTYKLALFGHPVAHSLSPQIQQQFAGQFDLDIEYELIDVTAKNLQKTVVKFFKKGGHGANITLPHKQQVINIVANISRLAQAAKAVNTLSLDDNKIIGDNTDGIGFINDLTKRCECACADKKILILGAGGATQGIVPAIMQHHPNKVLIANRTLLKAEKIAVYANTCAIDFGELDNLNESFDLIIHASSLGHSGKTLKFNQRHIHKKTICYDLSYGKAAAAFIEFSKIMAVQSTYDGIGMLIEQAALAFELWFKLKPDTNLVQV